MSDEYRRVLHEWARTQLETKSVHIGPFTIRDVRMGWDDAYGTGEHSQAEIVILFDHSDTCTLFPRFGSDDPRCTYGRWSMDGQHMVQVLNELFAIAARQETHP